MGGGGLAVRFGDGPAYYAGAGEDDLGDDAVSLVCGLAARNLEEGRRMAMTHHGVESEGRCLGDPMVGAARREEV